MRFSLRSIRGVMLFALLCASCPVAAMEQLEQRWRLPLVPGFVAPVAVEGGALLLDGDGDLVVIDATLGPQQRTKFEHVVGTLYGGRTVASFDDLDRLISIDRVGDITATDLCLPAQPSGTGARDGAVVVQPLRDATMVAIDVHGAAVLWRTELRSSRARVAILQTLVVAVSEGTVEVFSIVDGSELSSFDMPSIDALPALAGDVLLMGSPGDRIVGVYPRRGKRKFRAQIGFGPSTDLLSGGDVALVATQANQLVAMRGNGSPRWRAALPGRVLAPLTRWGDQVVVAPYRRKELLGFAVRDGKPSMTAPLTNATEWLEGDVLPVADSLLVVARKGTGHELVCFSRRLAKPEVASEHADDPASTGRDNGAPTGAVEEVGLPVRERGER